MKGLKLATAAVACGLIFVPPVLASGDQPAKVLEDAGAYAEAVALLEREASNQLTRHLQERGELRQISVSIRLDVKARSMVISFGPGYLPGPDRGYDELFLIPMASTLRYYAEKSGLDVNDIDFLFDGKPLRNTTPRIWPFRRRRTRSRRIHQLWCQQAMATSACIPAENGSFSAQRLSAFRKTR